MDPQNLTTAQQVVVYLLAGFGIFCLWSFLSLLWKIPAFIEAKTQLAHAHEDLARTQIDYYTALADKMKALPQSSEPTAL